MNQVDKHYKFLVGKDNEGFFTTLEEFNNSFLRSQTLESLQDKIIQFIRENDLPYHDAEFNVETKYYHARGMAPYNKNKLADDFREKLNLAKQGENKKGKLRDEE